MKLENKKVKKIRLKTRKAKGKRIKRQKISELPLPSDEQIKKLADLLEKQIIDQEKQNKYASVKQILTILGTGAVLALSLLTPTAAMLAKPFLDEKRKQERERWKQYNPYYLKRTIDRLNKQKLVEIKEIDGEQTVILTKNGKRHILKYSLDNLSIKKPLNWDGKWRLILYDVNDQRKILRDIFREALRALGFYQLQESAWIFPYPCDNEISFLREYYGVGNEVIYVIASKIEDDSPYKTYFNLD